MANFVSWMLTNATPPCSTTGRQDSDHDQRRADELGPRQWLADDRRLSESYQALVSQYRNRAPGPEGNGGESRDQEADRKMGEGVGNELWQDRSRSRDRISPWAWSGHHHRLDHADAG